MGFSLPITVIIALVFLTAAGLEKAFHPKSEPPLLPTPDTIAVAIIPPAKPILTPAPKISLPVAFTSLAYGYEAYTDTGVSASPGFRVQLAAVKDEVKARSLQQSLKSDLGYGIYILKEEGMWKLRAGDFKDEATAQALCQGLKKDKYPDAFVVGSPIYRLADGYRVQVATMRTKAAAIEYANKIPLQLQAERYLIREEDFWKLRLGDFLDRRQADELCTKLRAMQFPDAFVVKDKVRR